MFRNRPTQRNHPNTPSRCGREAAAASEALAAPAPPWSATVAILAGGASRRMGRDKSAVYLFSKTLLQRRLDALASLFRQTLVVADDWASLPLGSARGVPDRWVPGGPVGRAGPLAGVAGALAEATHDRVVVTAVDMPFARPRLLELLLTWSAADPTVDVVVPEAAGGRGLEPLCACYRRGALEQLDARLAAGKLGLQAAVRALRLRVVPERRWRPLDPDGRAFWNVNTPEDLARVRAAGDDGTPPAYSSREATSRELGGRDGDGRDLPTAV